MHLGNNQLSVDMTCQESRLVDLPFQSYTKNKTLRKLTRAVAVYLEISEPYPAVKVCKTQHVIVERFRFRVHVRSSEHLKI